MRGKNARRLWPAALGFFVVFNLYVPLGSRGEQVRVADVIGLLLWAWLPVAFLRTFNRGDLLAVRLLTMVLALLPWGYYFVMGDAGAGTNIFIRWFLLLPIALLLATAATATRARATYLLMGIVVGAVANLAVLKLQQLSLANQLTDFGLIDLDAPRTIAEDTDRMFGIQGHPNAAAAVCSLALPAVLSLVDAGRLRARWVVGALAVVYLSSTLTLTRSAVTVSGLVFCMWLITSPRRLSIRASAPMVAMIVLGIIALGPPSGNERWERNQAFVSNREGRVDSTSLGIDALVAHPSGAPLARLEQIDLDTAGTPLSHNAFVFIGLLAGLPLALLLLISLVRHALAVGKQPSITCWFAMQMIGLFLFEDHLSNPTFIMLAEWLVLASPTAFASLRDKEGFKAALVDGHSPVASADRLRAPSIQRR